MSYYDVSELVAKGHPDKVADQISDAILDACLHQDPLSRVAVETLVSHELIAIGGEISTFANIDVKHIVSSVLKGIGYDIPQFGDMVSQAKIVSSLVEQSPDIAGSVGDRKETRVAAGDQGVMYGFATDETSSYLPRAYEIARRIIMKVQEARALLSWLGPDGKTQVALSRKEPQNGSIILSWQHREDISVKEVQEHLSPLIQEIVQEYQLTPKIIINPSGRFVCGGPFADSGVTGRKQVGDSYGSCVPHGGGAYSGKDATKVDRSAAYMARWVAKHIVAAGLARQCLVQLVYCIGQEMPIGIEIECYESERVDRRALIQAVQKTFDFSVSAMIDALQLRTPFFQELAFGGHFGRSTFPWEQVVHSHALLSALR